MMVQVITIKASRECSPPEAFGIHYFVVFIFLALFAFAAHAVFVVVVDYGLRTKVAINCVTA